MNEPQIAEILKQKESLEVQQIVFLIERTAHYIKEVKLATNQHLWLEVGIIDLANMTENSTLLDLQNRVRNLESGSIVTQSVSMPSMITRPAPIQPPVAEPIVAIQQQNVAETVVAKQKTEDIFTPPPMSKKPSGSDIGSLWQALLMNIKSPSTQALLKLATPLKISAEGIVITFKNERLVSQLNDSNKKQLVLDAANVLYNNTNPPVTIRLAQSGDKVETNSTTAPAISQPVKQQKPEMAKESGSTLTEIQVEEGSDIVIDKEKKDASARLETDQERMVLDLFDGKYVE